MNIRETKQAIKDALEAYRARDKYGSPIIPVERDFPHVDGKPFTITEWNFSGPGRYRGVGGILTGATAAL